MQKVLFTIFIFSLPSSSIAQDSIVWSSQADTLCAVKRKCSCDYSGAKIQIVEGSSEIAVLRNYPAKVPVNCTYSHETLYQSSDIQKAQLLSRLLEFLDDTSTVCVQAKAYAIGLKDSLGYIKQKKYSVQIDALYHINFICFGQYASLYAPFPVLYNTEEKREINTDQIQVRAVCAIYRNWLKKCLKAGFKNYRFPLLDMKYKWRYGDSTSIVIKSLPRLSLALSERIGKPKTM